MASTGPSLLLSLLLLFSAVNFCYAKENEQAKATRIENHIQQSSGSEKIAHMVEYMSLSSRFNPEKTLKYGHQALEILAQRPNAHHQSRIYNSMARAAYWQRRLPQALEWARQSGTIAEEHNQLLNKLEAWRTLSDIYFEQEKYPDAENLASRSIDLATEMNRDWYLAHAWLKLGDIERRRMDFKSALRYYLQVHKLAEQLDDSWLISGSFYKLASMYRRMGMYETALSYQWQSLERLKEHNEPRLLAPLYSNLGLYLKEVNDYEGAIRAHEQSLALKQSIDYSQGILHSTIHMAELHRLTGKFSEAESLYKQALDMEKQLDNPIYLAWIYYWQGRLYMDLGQFDLAEKHFDESLPMYQQDKYAYRRAEIHLDKGRLYQHMGQYDRAIEETLKTVEISIADERERYLVEAYKALASLYEQTNDLAKALEYTQVYLSLKEKTEALNNQHRIDALTVEFNVAEKNREIANLTQQNQINALQLEKQSVQQRVIVISLLLAFCFLLFAYYWRNKNTQIKIEKAALKQVSEAKERLSHALWGSGDELWDWDLRSGYITRENQMAQLRLPSEHIGSTLDTIKASIHPDDFPLLSDSFHQHLQGDLDFYEASYRVMTETGDWLWVADRGKITARTEDGRPERITGTIRDISMMKASELALAELNASLEHKVEERTAKLKQSRDELANTLEELTTTQANLVEARKMASLGRLVAGVSHELNTPLGNSVTASSLLKEELTSFKNKFEENRLTRSDTRNFMDVTLSSTDLLEANILRAAQLVKRFKQVSVHENSDSRRQIQIKQCLDAFVAVHTDHEHVSVVVDCPVDTAARVDPQVIEKVLYDLYQNALTHGVNEKQTVEICIRVTEAEGLINLYFSDNGQGIQDEIVPHLFDPFYTTARHKGNVGLGLYMVFTLVTQILEGKIEHQNTKNGGAMFVITFPVSLTA